MTPLSIHLHTCNLTTERHCSSCCWFSVSVIVKTDLSRCVKNKALRSEIKIKSSHSSQVVLLISLYGHLSVSALLWLSLAACRSLSRRFFSDSSFSASLGSRCWRGLTYCSSFSSSSFSLMRMRRSRSGSSSPGHASLSSLAIWTSMVAILTEQGHKRMCRTEMRGREEEQTKGWRKMWI